MPDITMCFSLECPKRGDCYRVQAKPSRWQSFSNYYREGKRCGNFWPMKPKEVSNETLP